LLATCIRCRLQFRVLSLSLPASLEEDLAIDLTVFKETFLDGRSSAEDKLVKFLSDSIKVRFSIMDTE